nr:AraC family transcriptional regulator [uncultured Eisenbergiella sp.]
MDHNQTLQTVLDYIENNISGEIHVPELAKKAGYSVYYFSRIFTDTIGISVMSYVTWRKLQYALYDLSQGKKVIDAAMDYGFETHGGFTKAFMHWFGFPPSLCRSHLHVDLPVKMNVTMLKNKFYGGNMMNPHIIELTPFSVVGFPERYRKANRKNTADTPTYWNTIHLDYATILTELYDIFPKSKHFEISMCYDVDVNTGEFSYILGRGIDNPDDLANIRNDMTRVAIDGGLYAVFSTPPAADSYIQAAQDTWNAIFLNWLPQSEFVFDETRNDFEYHDHRDHGWYFGGKLQIDICIPIRQKEEEIRKAQLRCDR